MIALQKLYMVVLNNIFKATGKLSEKTRDAMFFLMLFSMEIVMLFFQYLTKIGSSFGYKELFLVNTTLLCLAIVFSVKEELHLVEWRKWLFYAWFICGILIALPIPDLAGRGTFIMFGLTISFVWPAFFFVWNNRGDYGKMYRLVAIATVISTAVFFIACMLTEPFNKISAYEGLTNNPNLLGMSSIAGAVSALALICNEEKTKYFYIIAFGFFIAFTWMSGSRASLLTISLSALAFFVGRMRNIQTQRTSKKGLIVELLALLVISLLVTCAIEKFMARNLPTYNDTALIEANGAVQEDEIVLNQENDTSSDIHYTMTDKFERDGDISTGRIDIWKYYIQNLRVIGHSRADGDPYVPSRYAKVPAHNTYIEIAYRSGVPSGFIYAGIAIFAAIWSLSYLLDKRKKIDSSIILAAVAVIAFGVIANIENGIYPVQKEYILLYYLALAPMFESNRLKNGEI